MAKPTVTEQDVSAGIKSLGGFGGLTRSSTSTRRDSPFGSSFAKPQQQQDPAPVEAAAPANQTPITPSTTAAAPSPALESTPSEIAEKRVGGAPRESTARPAPIQPAPLQVIQLEATAVVAPPSAAPAMQEAPLPEVAPPSERPSRKSAPKPPPPASPRAATPTIPKTELYTERVTVLMDASMRDELNKVAHLLQRRKSDSTERITANTITRVAVRLLLEELKPSESDTPKTEAELYQLTKAKLRANT